MDAIKEKHGKYTVNDQLFSIDSFRTIVLYSLTDETPEDILEYIKYFQTNKTSMSLFMNQKNKLLYIILFWYFFSTDHSQLILSHKNFMIRITSTFFYHKLRQFIENKFQTLDCYDTMNPEIHYSSFISICHQSKEAFQFFYRYTARQMIECKFPEQIQLFLNDTLFDIRLRKESLDHFFEMYEDGLQNYVIILGDIVYNSYSDSEPQQRNNKIAQNSIALKVLNHLRTKNFEDFVVCVTHFKDFLYLLNENE